MDIVALSPSHAVIYRSDPFHIASEEEVAARRARAEELNRKRRESRSNGADHYNGYLSPNSVRIIKRRLITWLSAIDLYRSCRIHGTKNLAYPVFLTVTLPSEQIHTDQEIRRRSLTPFIKALQFHGVKHYFYRSEAQTNGRIHFHFIIDRYIDKDIIYELWARSINILGYVDRYKGPGKPPCVQVTAIKSRARDGSRNSVVNYVTGYVLKAAKPGGDTRAINGRLWGMSKALKELRSPRMEATEEVGVSLKQLETRTGEHFTVHFGRVFHALPKRLKGLVRQYYSIVFDHLYKNLRYFNNINELFIDTVSCTIKTLEEMRSQFMQDIEKTVIDYRDRCEQVFKEVRSIDGSTFRYIGA